MNEPTIRRRRRRATDSQEIDISSQNIETLVGTNKETETDNAPPNILQSNVEHRTNNQIAVDRIRSEIQDEEHHSLLDEPNYSDDTHDWSDNYELVSSDYWHFLGRYE